MATLAFSRVCECVDRTCKQKCEEITLLSSFIRKSFSESAHFYSFVLMNQLGKYLAHMSFEVD